MDTITVNKKDLEVVAKKGGEWAITREAEEYIHQLATIKEWAEEALDAVKKQLVDSLADSDTKTIRGKNYTAFIRSWGDKYTTDNPEFMREISYMKADVEKIEGYAKEHGRLPHGTIEKPQEIKCSFRKK